MSLLAEIPNQQARAKVGVYGRQGSGKTSLVALLAIATVQKFCGKECDSIAFYDSEGGSDFMLPIFRAEGIRILRHKGRSFKDLMTVAREAEMRGVDGVVCGHIHHAEIRRIGGVLYLNDGDWVESCSALVEDAQGNMEILRWADPQQRHATRPSGGIAVVAARRGKQAAPVPA